MAGFGVSPEKEKALACRMGRLGIREADIRESFIRAQGPGGQNVNKLSSCVYLRHVPTGIEVKCQRERSQALNRYVARRLLTDKVESLVLGELSRQRQRIEKIRRQKRKRSGRAKLKMLEGKRIHSEKKRLRSRMRTAEIE